MGFNSTINVHGKMTADLYGPDGELKDHREVDNTVTALCLAMCTNRVSDSVTVAIVNWMELGTGSGQGAGDTILDSYVAGSRTVLDSSTAVAGVLTMICTFPAGTGTGAITEAGTFNVVTQNTTDLITYASFTVINKGAADALVVTWTLTLSG